MLRLQLEEPSPVSELGWVPFEDESLQILDEAHLSQGMDLSESIVSWMNVQLPTPSINSDGQCPFLRGDSRLVLVLPIYQLLTNAKVLESGHPYPMHVLDAVNVDAIEEKGGHVLEANLPDARIPAW